jgi:hypothetical protein
MLVCDFGSQLGYFISNDTAELTELISAERQTIVTHSMRCIYMHGAARETASFLQANRMQLRDTHIALH